MAFITREEKGSRLTHEEMDGNVLEAKTRLEAAELLAIEQGESISMQNTNIEAIGEGLNSVTETLGNLIDITIFDSVSEPYTKSSINEAYPNAIKGQIVVCDNAFTTYIKKDNSPTGDWSTFPTVQLT